MTAVLRPYMGFVRDTSDECAVMVFAPTARAARRLAATALSSLVEARYIEVRAIRLRKFPNWYESLRQGDAPHIIDNPPSCDRCHTWGAPITNGVCSWCEADA